MPTTLDFTPGVVEMIHGVPVPDPYRWLEDRNSIATEHWIAQQRTHLASYLQGLGPLHTLRERVTKFVDVETVDQLGKVQDRYFYCRRGVGEQQPSIYVMDSAEGPERLLINSSDEGLYVAVGIHRVSEDGALLAYEVKHGGEHTKAVHIVDVNTGTVLPDHLDRGLARGFVFRNANDGFYYCHEFADDPIGPDSQHSVLFHRFGAPREDDVVLLTLPRARASKLVLIYGGQLLGAAYYHEVSGVLSVDLYVSKQECDHSWRCFRRNTPAPFGAFFHRERIFAHRFDGAPNGEIVELDSTNGTLSRVVVPEWHLPAKQCAIVLNQLYVSYVTGTETVVRIWSLDGACLGTLPLEPHCTWGLVPAYTNEADRLFLHCESFSRPPTLFCYDPKTRERVVWNQRHAPAWVSSIAAQRLMYCSSDGTEVAISLVCREDGSPMRDRPTIMTSYGGFGLTMTPQFSTFVSVLLDLGFVFAIPEIRGGGGPSRSWHEAARGRHRQVAFDDFIAAAEWLCNTGLTTPRQLAIFGGSNSGILVGAAITQRPDLFGAALCIAPLLDMVRYHLFDRARVWTAEYGTAEDPDDFHALFAYSPYHNIRDDTDYPAIMFVCGDKDTRCNPAHSRKMAARLGDRPSQSRLILIDHSTERGHAATMPLSVRIDALTHRIAFLCHELGLTNYQGEA